VTEDADDVIGWVQTLATNKLESEIVGILKEFGIECVAVGTMPRAMFNLPMFTEFLVEKYGNYATSPTLIQNPSSVKAIRAAIENFLTEDIALEDCFEANEPPHIDEKDPPTGSESK